jgi:hypothetical protein
MARRSTRRARALIAVIATTTALSIGCPKQTRTDNSVAVGPQPCDLNPADTPANYPQLSINAGDTMKWSTASGTSGQLSIKFRKAAPFPTGTDDIAPLENMGTPDSNGDYVITNPGLPRGANPLLQQYCANGRTLTYKYDQIIGSSSPCDGHIIIKW